MEETNTDNIEEKKEIPQHRDLLSSYLYYRNYISTNPIEEFNVKRKCIEIGKELLYLVDDNEKKEKIDELITKAIKKLKVKPAKRNIDYSFADHGGKIYPIYKITSEDADRCQAVGTELKEMLNNFAFQQHEQHIDELTEIDNEIFHMLVSSGSIPLIRPTVDEALEKMMVESIEGEK